MSDHDTCCRCEVCGREERIVLAERLHLNWPTCHDRWMRVVETDANVAASLNQAMNRWTPILADALRAAEHAEGSCHVV